MGPKPFTIEVPAEVLDDLRSRLARTRWPPPLPYPGWVAGADIGYLKELLAYWRDSFDWRLQERRLNSFAQFTADVGGQRVHFVHERGRGPGPFPLVLTHGWPGTFAELLKLAPLLTDPAAHGGDERDSFDVVIPSLPGFAFSAAPAAPGTATARAWAGLWAQLMTESLGYRRFGAQGQDIGAAVSIALAANHPGVVAGIHLPGVVAFPASWRNSGPGATATATSNGGSPKTSCSPPSPCTGSPARSARPSSSTTTASSTAGPGRGGSKCRSG